MQQPCWERKRGWLRLLPWGRKRVPERAAIQEKGEEDDGTTSAGAEMADATVPVSEKAAKTTDALVPELERPATKATSGQK